MKEKKAVCLLAIMVLGILACNLSQVSFSTSSPTQPQPVLPTHPATQAPTVFSPPTATLLPPTQVPATSTQQLSLSTATTVLNPTATPIMVTGYRVIYHEGEERNGVGYYKVGKIPWLDLLVQLNGQWYGPERQLTDDIQPAPLLFGFFWSITGGFMGDTKGKAWWTETINDGKAVLYSPDGIILLEVPLKVVFEGSEGEDEDDDWVIIGGWSEPQSFLRGLAVSHQAPDKP